MKKFCKRILIFSISLIMIFSLTLSLYTPATAMAATGSERFKKQVTVSHNKSYNKDGKQYMSLKLSNYLDHYRLVDYSAKVVNSSGKIIYKWPVYRLKPGESKDRILGADYSSLPKGLYTLILTADDKIHSSTWKYSIRHKHPASLSFKSFEKVRDSKGVMRYQFNIQCTNIKGEKLTIKIYDSNGNVVYKATGPARKTDNEVGFFGWSGWANVGSKQKCKSGQYTVEVFSSDGTNGIQNTYNLIY